MAFRASPVSARFSDQAEGGSLGLLDDAELRKDFATLGQFLIVATVCVVWWLQSTCPIQSQGVPREVRHLQYLVERRS